MSESDPVIQQQIIEHVLGLQDSRERAEFQARSADDPQLACQVNALRRALAPLEAWKAPEPCASLVEDILHRVETTSPLEYVAASTAIPPEAAVSSPRRSIISLREVLALAACIGLLVSAFVPGVANMRSRQLQAMCGDNLAGFYQGVSQYAAEYDAFLPSMPDAAAANWLHQPNRHHYLPAIRMRFLAPKVIFCPSTPDKVPDDGAVLKDPAAFLNRMSFRFYSTQNMNGPVLRFTARIRMPLAADTNPVFEGGRFHPDATRPVNSRAHGGWGQNVLFLDGSTSFLRTPVYGNQADNIWQAENVQRYFGTETQRCATDAFLIP